ncbi:M20/M25/M40 family metallo-hydrolase [Bacillus amyloliquefaciens]|uniref:M20/M25/M40 family metallo-hydrolase n=1 Tax=Bacillus amyloliquefaciens TaxID=1390 RepID=UPI003A89C824
MNVIPSLATFPVDLRDQEAGYDAQMMARICPTAMIFVPSIEGISHNPKEYTKDHDLAAGADILLDVVCDLSSD